ncbi:hypothetical protein SAMN04489727_1903 [Amycolatopsis tolypomycina]|uniref:Excreted virulence factor EspC, type VII ESX diderm n=1 Tax=Amycolatopsis tolypomycina TaxID=208445 RepID=A0A1H4JHE4_9PSEU|nr:hypothetical protein [Amycolatopsis tolypomycina]SEB45691.1 hypothetical protein SAMN04489727_1903 [Amycolatopsis tolypomycina]
MAEHGFRVQPATLTAAADRLQHTAADLKAASVQLDDLGRINLGASTDAVAAVIRDIRDRASGAARAVATHADSLRQAHHRYTTYERACTASLRGLVKDEP